MLPRWRKKQTLVLSPDALLLNDGRQACSALLSREEDSQHIDFDILSAALPAEMQKLAGKPVDIILANSWVRYLIIPWQPHLFSRADWQAVAERKFREVYGNSSSHWNIVLSMQGYGKPLVAAAVDREVCEGLERLALQQHWQLDHITPAFSALTQRYARHWHGHAWLLMLEHNRLLLAQSDSGVWKQFKLALPPQSDIAETAATLVRQARQSQIGNAKLKLYIYQSSNVIGTDFGDGIEARILNPDTSSAAASTLLDYGVLS